MFWCYRIYCVQMALFESAKLAQQDMSWFRKFGGQSTNQSMTEAGRPPFLVGGIHAATNGPLHLFCSWLRPIFSGLFAGVSPKIQTRLYRAWPVVCWHITAKTSQTMTLSIVLHSPLSPWRQNKPWDISGNCRPFEYRSVAASDGRD